MSGAIVRLGACLACVTWQTLVLSCIFLLGSLRTLEAYPQSALSEIEYDDPEINALRSHYYNKRFMPHWHHSLSSMDYDRYSSPIAQMKRFLPFHPLARFRGLTSGGSGGGAGSGVEFMSATYPTRHRQNFQTYVSSASQPSPGHPVPSDTKPAKPSLHMETPQVEGTQSDTFSSAEDPGASEEDMSVGEILRYLKSTSNNNHGYGKPRFLRFGIK